MKVKVKNHQYTKTGTIIEVSDPAGQYMINAGQADLVEGASDKAHDIVDVPVVANAHLPEKIVKATGVKKHVVKK